MTATRQRRLLTATAAVGLAGLALAGCSTPSESETEQIELVLQITPTANMPEETWEGFLEQFEEENPDIRITTIVPPQEGGAPAFTRQLVAAGTPPDMTMSPGLNADFYELLLPFELTDEIKAIDGYEQIMSDGEMYQLPSFAVQPVSLVFYNVDLFEQAGIDDEPTTWDEFHDVADQLKDSGITPFIMPGEWVPGFILKQMGAVNTWPEHPDWYSEYADGEHEFAEGGWLEAAEEYAYWRDHGYINEGALGDGAAQGEQNFMEGRGAMYSMGTWFSVTAANAPFEVGVFALPSTAGENILAASFNSMSPAILKTTKYPEQATRLANFLAFNQELIDTRIEAEGLFLVEGTDYSMSPLQQDIAEMVSTYTVVVSSNGLGDNYPPGTSMVEMDAAAQAILLGADPEEELRKVDAAARP